MWVVKTDSVGNKLWTACVGSTWGDDGFSVCELADSSVILTGYGSSHFTNYHSGGSDIEVGKFDKSGNLLWTKCYGGSGLENAVKFLSDGLNFFILGITTSSDGDVTTSLGGVDVWIVKVDSAGNKIWDRSYGGSDWDNVNGATRTSDGGIAFIGWSHSNDGVFVTSTHGGEDIWAAKIDSMGNLEWGKSIGGSLNDEGNSIAEIDAHHYVLCGYSYSSDGDMPSNHGSKDAWIGELEVSPVNVLNTIGQPFSLNTSYDDDYLKIKLISPYEQEQRISVYDVLGRTKLNHFLELKQGHNDLQIYLPELKGVNFVKVGNSVSKIIVE